MPRTVNPARAEAIVAVENGPVKQIPTGGLKACAAAGDRIVQDFGSLTADFDALPTDACVAVGRVVAINADDIVLDCMIPTKNLQGHRRGVVGGPHILHPGQPVLCDYVVAAAQTDAPAAIPILGVVVETGYTFALGSDSGHSAVGPGPNAVLGDDIVVTPVNVDGFGEGTSDDVTAHSVAIAADTHPLG